MKKHGHYCKVCGEYKANEKFSGKGHAAHICKACSGLPPEKRSEMMILNKLVDLPWRLSNEQRNWLKNKTHDRRRKAEKWHSTNTISASHHKICPSLFSMMKKSTWQIGLRTIYFWKYLNNTEDSLLR